MEVRKRRVESRDAQFISEKLRNSMVWKGKEGEQREHAVDRPTIEEPTLEKSLPAFLGVVICLDSVVVTTLVAIKELFESSATPRVIPKYEVRKEFVLTPFESGATKSLTVCNDRWPILAIRETNFPITDTVVNLVTEAWRTSIHVNEAEHVSDRFDQVRFTCPVLADHDSRKPFLIEIDIDALQVFESVNVYAVETHQAASSLISSSRMWPFSTSQAS